MLLIFANILTFLFIICLSLIFIANANIYCFFFLDLKFFDILYLIIFVLLFLSFKTKNLIITLLCILFTLIFFSFGIFSIFIYLPTLMFIIVYLGALMMLFVFVVMLFNVQQNKNEVSHLKLIGFIIASFFANTLANFFCVVNNKIYDHPNIIPTDLYSLFFFNSYTLNGNTIFIPLFNSKYNIAFVLLTLILLTTLIVSITIIFLTKSTTIKK